MRLFHSILLILIFNQYRLIARRNSRKVQKFSRGDEESEHSEIRPVRVDQAGNAVFPTHKQFLSFDDKDNSSESVYYNITAFGRTFNLELTRDRSIVSPELSVEYVFSWDNRLEQRPDLGFCLYKGKREDSHSSAMFNLCNGLQGSFITDGHEYLVEKKRNQGNGSNIHIISRRLDNDKQENRRDSKTFCGLQETSAKKNYSELQEHVDYPPKRRRSKRYLSAAYVETMITVDKTMVEEFSNEVELRSFLITVMGLVARIYSHESIGNLIKVVLVKMFILENDSSDLKITSNAANSLTNFCRWQKKMNQGSTHYDTAILITKQDLCRARGKCDTLGLAQVDSICHARRSCAIVEATGLNTAYTLAHELAHIFGVSHDGDGNHCSFSSRLSRIMAPTLSVFSKPWEWSPCSRKAFSDVLELGHGADCLKNRPSSSHTYDRKLPGELYTVDDQCRMIMGRKARACSHLEVCQRLWCTVDGNCSTHHLHWADGTPCGPDKWCIEHKCVPRQRHRVINGGWSSWTPYGLCTRTCGGGIQFSARKCNNPTPANGGMYCYGPRKRFKSCNSEECPPNSLDFRSVQCAKFNNKAVTIGMKFKNITWIPKFMRRDSDKCKLYCKVRGSRIHYRLSDKVIDGTPCELTTNDICVEGKCLKAGCDHVVGSMTRIDKCGVCGGDNTTCATINGSFNKKPKYGFNFVYDIPAGSTNIVIQQHGHSTSDDNYLALGTAGRHKKNFFNTKRSVIYGIRELMFHGIKIWYSGSDRQIEEIRVFGKTTQVLRLQVIAFGDRRVPPRISYTMNVPRVKPSRFYWSPYGEWGHCDRHCRGRRKRRILCLRRSDNKVVKERRCNGLPRPNVFTQVCNTHCALRWFATKIGKCSTLCGEGLQEQRVRCIWIYGPGFVRWESVSDDRCKHIRKPPSSIPCKGPCETHWAYDDWSKCSRSCGSGIQHRSANCINTGGEYVADKDCKLSERQVLRRSCFEQECPDWIADHWSRCSVTCGQGVEVRKVTCSSESKQYQPFACNKDKRPAERRPCTMQQCPYWVRSQWSECSVTCGNGMQERRVLCRSSQDKALVSVIQCDTSQKPDSYRKCSKPVCPTGIQESPRRIANWLEGDWSECSATCGKGMKRRLVMCTDRRGERVESENCDRNTKPKTEEECELKSCTSWKFGQWGTCSRSCGKGLQLRIVKCAYDSWRLVDDSQCKGTKKPLDHRECQLRPCQQTTKQPFGAKEYTTTIAASRWERGNWNDCSVTCGKGVRKRSVQCKFITGQRSSFCPSATKPQSIQACNPGPCPQWKTGDWSPCSVTCGSGEMTRSVTCNTNRAKCDDRHKPSDRQACVLESCPVWTAGSWSKCSKTCGGGVRRRTIKCSRTNGGCSPSSKPADSEQCNKQECPRWTAGSWTQCSKSCGDGVQSRKVECSIRGRCEEKTRPPLIQRCNLGQCPVWVTEKWSTCSVSCGRGVTTREITCSSGKDNCDKDSKPLSRKDCTKSPCPFWTAGQWSKCSTSCGRGVQRRLVVCEPRSGRCDHRLKPDQTKWCNLGLCPSWTTTDWSQCSVSCGEGVKRREVECNSTVFKCDDKERRKDVARCNLGKCPKWTSTQWSQCSSSCGQGIQTRTVTCDPPSSRCDSWVKPETNRACNLGLCPAWATGTWSKCSVSCGVGTRSRSVQCNSTVFECDQSKRPSGVERCNRGTCPVWNAGRWSECSSSCGDGVQVRTIKCQPSSAKCSHHTKPLNSRKCNLGDCPSWKSSPWSRCSVSCGEGIRRRTVQCKSKLFSCDGNLRPVDAEGCNPGKCPEWVTGHWSACSSSCGDGVQRRQVTCEPPSSRCNRDLKPVDTKPCNIGSCPAWKTGEWTKCSVSCGSGVRTRSVLCNSTTIRCNPTRRPVNVESCNRGPCPVWTAGHWSVCSVTCGQGVRSRDVECSTRDAPCTSTKPQTTRLCEMDPCPRWVTSPWQQCSVTCGKGIQKRSVLCSTNKNKCDSDNRPADVQNCELVKCPEWKLGDWDQCSVSCGVGVQDRTVYCDSDSQPCDPNKRPDIKRVCNANICPTWVSGEWSKCSVSCGRGVRTRSVTCYSDGLLCEARTKPEITQICNSQKCPTWVSGEWSSCSASCGEGFRTRSVTCNSYHLPCDAKTKPDIKRVCNSPKCPTWESREWSSCSASCGEGFRTRSVTCNSDHLPCDAKTKPDIKRVCNSPKCPTWESGEWSSCSASCGEGFRTRSVTCNSDHLPCDAKTKPDIKRVCNSPKCPTWESGEWSSCSASCGSGVQTRSVTCNSDLPCDTISRPDIKRACNIHSCPTWEIGKWSRCSVSCGKGVQIRRITCSSTTYECDKITKPMDVRQCVKNCSIWRAEPWQKCSVSCGHGVQLRKVYCNNQHGPCHDSNARPRNTRRCKLRDCPVWVTGEWSKCSADCGKGIQERFVSCSSSKLTCNQTTKPVDVKDCQITECPSWKADQWSHCSRTCGNGITSRQIHCVKGEQTLRHSECARFVRPVTRKLCRIRDCIRGTYWKKGQWGKCSAQCSKGFQIRQVSCTALNGSEIDSLFCGRRRKPDVIRACNEHKQCGDWEMGPWSKCSTSCGDGVRLRAVRCLYNLGYSSEEDCDASTRPIDHKSCVNQHCPLASKLFAWRTSPWSKCSRTCGYGRKSRVVTCSDDYGGQVSNKYCDADSKPAEFQACFEVRCPPKWKFGDWSECSKTCGGGYQVRPVTCEGVPGSGGCNVRHKPPVWRPCNFGPCGQPFLWKIGAWTRCSVTCGVGVIVRSVRCVDRDGRRKDDSNCKLPALRPDETRPCTMRPCTPKSCRDVQLTSGLQADGEHVLEIQGKLRKIYCHGMTTNNPKEYLTLKKSYTENFSEIYAKRLLDPNSCPVIHSDECPCHRESYQSSGGSYFSKIRVNLSTMTIDGNDLQFAKTRGNKPPPYATAGDCYSRNRCPQGRFSINLDGTGFALSLDVRWTTAGNSASQEIYFHPEGMKVFGKCGGYCGKCMPNRPLQILLSKGNELG